MSESERIAASAGLARERLLAPSSFPSRASPLGRRLRRDVVARARADGHAVALRPQPHLDLALAARPAGRLVAEQVVGVRLGGDPAQAGLGLVAGEDEASGDLREAVLLLRQRELEAAPVGRDSRAGRRNGPPRSRGARRRSPPCTPASSAAGRTLPRSRPATCGRAASRATRAPAAARRASSRCDRGRPRAAPPARRRSRRPGGTARGHRRSRCCLSARDAGPLPTCPYASARTTAQSANPFAMRVALHLREHLARAAGTPRRCARSTTAAARARRRSPSRPRARPSRGTGGATAARSRRRAARCGCRRRTAARSGPRRARADARRRAAAARPRAGGLRAAHDHRLEARDGLRPAAVADVEVGRGQAGDGPAVPVDDDGVDAHQLDRRAEDGRRLAGGRAGRGGRGLREGSGKRGSRSTDRRARAGARRSPRQAHATRGASSMGRTATRPPGRGASGRCSAREPVERLALRGGERDDDAGERTRAAS